MYIWWHLPLFNFRLIILENQFHIYFLPSNFSLRMTERIIIPTIKMSHSSIRPHRSLPQSVRRYLVKKSCCYNIFSFLSRGLQNATIVTGIAAVRRDERWPIVNQWIISSRKTTVTDRAGINPRFYANAMVHTK